MIEGCIISQVSSVLTNLAVCWLLHVSAVDVSYADMICLLERRVVGVKSKMAKGFNEQYHTQDALKNCQENVVRLMCLLDEGRLL